MCPPHFHALPSRGHIPLDSTALSQLASSSAVPLTAVFQAANINSNPTTHIASPSTLAMPPPPSQPVPTLPLSNYFTKCSAGATAIESGNSSSKLVSSPTTQSKAASKQPPIYDIISEWEDKKQAKRAANRLSAHLSRKRKKLFMDDLKDENSELRRKEQILRSIPDLIIVFDSSGLISFVSHSVTRFMNYTVEELEDTCFWGKLSEGSVRLIKSAFMDALAVKRSPEEDSTPLLNGESITVTLIQKNDDDQDAERDDKDRRLVVSLKGVVHFGGEYPECVCSIRPEVLATFNVTPAIKGVSHISTTAVLSSKRQDESGRPPFFEGKTQPPHQVSDIDSEKG